MENKMEIRLTEQNTIADVRNALKEKGFNPTRALQHTIIQGILNGSFVLLNDENLIIIDSVGH